MERKIILISLLILTVALFFSQPNKVKLDESIKHDKPSLVNQGEMNKSQELVISNEPIRPDESESKKDSKKIEAVVHAPAKRVTVLATAYCGIAKKKKHKAQLKKMNGTGITKSGQRAEFGGLAADLDRYPIGTVFYVPEFGRSFVVNDSGGSISGNHIDIFMGWGNSAYKDAIKFGKQNLEVWVMVAQI